MIKEKDYRKEILEYHVLQRERERERCTQNRNKLWKMSESYEAEEYLVNCPETMYEEVKCVLGMENKVCEFSGMKRGPEIELCDVAFLF